MNQLVRLYFRLKRQAYTHAIVIAGFALLVSSSLRGQSVANYGPVTLTTGIIYSSDSTTGSAIPAWRNNTPNNSNQDDNRSYPVNIGFDFWYDGVRYTQFSVSTNGFMDLSSATFDGGPNSRPFGPYDADFSSNGQSGGTVLGLAPLYYDMTTQGEIDPLGNSIKYLTTGSAPNRVLTVEWIDMSEWPNHSSNTNFQVKLFESTGVIEFLYGSMTPGSGFTWSYTLGINGPVLSATPTAAQLLIQQTQNTTTFNSTIQNSLATLPTSNSMLTFTPPTPANPTNLTFSNVQLTSMQLNWTDNANNEVGYVIYRSDDGGATYNFIHQLAANSTSSNETGLLAGTTYYWKVYAVTEGRLSAALLGSNATSPAPNVISTQTGPWNTGSTWVGGVVPAATANVTIADNTTVTLDGSDTANSVTVGQGGSGATLIIGNSATARTLTVNGGITVNAGAIVTINTSYSQTAHAINISGDIANSGVFTMEPSTTSRCVVTFNKNGAQNIEGSGTTRFGRITLNMGLSSSNILDVSASNFVDTVANFLTLSNGTFRLSTGATVTPFLGNVTIPLSAGLWLYDNSPTVTIPDSLIVSGSLRVSSGVLTIGNAADKRLMSNGGTFTIEGGTVNIAGRFAPYNGFTTTNFTMSGGILNVPTVGSTSTTDAPFSMSVAGSFFEMTGGTIVIKQAGGSNLGFLNTGSTSYSVTGGTIQIGDASTLSSAIIAIKSITPFYNFLISGTTPTVTARLDTFLVVKNNVTINSGNILNANANNISVAGLWSDAGSFTPTTATATFNGTGVQTITNASSAETFNKLTINNSTSVSLGSSTNATVADSFQILQGTFAVGVNTLTLNGAVASSGSLTSAVTGTVSYNKSLAGQTVLASNYGNLTFSNFTKTLPASGTVGIAGTFTPGNAAGHTITGSTVDFNGSGAQTVSSFTFNNLNLSNGGTKTVAAGSDTVQGILTIASGVTLADGGVSVRVFKNIVNNGTHSGAGNITLTGGTAAHNLSGTGTYTNLIMNDANGATLSNNLLINGVLTFTSGIITTSSADTVVIASTGSVSRTSGHVNGTLEKYFPTGSNILHLFEVGDASTYAPDTVTFASITTSGSLSSSVTAGDNPSVATSGVDANHDVNRYWTITNNGIVFTTYNATFDFVAGDIDAGSTTATFIVAKLDAAWSLPTVGTKTGTSTQATGINSIYASGSSFVVGNVATIATNSYRCVATGNWNALGTWQSFNGTSWVAAAVLPDSTKQNITVQSPYTVTVTANTNADQLEVQAGATLVINSGITFILHDGAGTDLLLEGTLTNTGTLTQGTATAIVSSGGLYNHNTNNTANLKATWDPNSTCQFTGVTNALPANLAQTFGHFTWSCASQTATLNVAGVLTTIAGNFTMTSTGTGELDLASTQSQTTSIGGSLSQTGGTFGLSTGNGTPTLSIAGNFSMSGGTLRMKGSGGANTGTSTMNVSGNFSFTAGAISENSTNNTGKGLIVFNGTSVQTYTSGGTRIATDSIGWTVNNGATLSMGTNIINGGGTFTLSSGATLGIGSTGGIAASGSATGNIQTTGRIYNAGANYIYNGVAVQSTGNGLPAVVNKLTINNSTGANLTNSVQTDSLYLTAGAFNVNAAVTLTINNLVTVSSGSLASAVTGTVNYSKPSNVQYLIAGSYGNLTFSNFSKVFPSSGTLSIAGTFTQGTGTGHVFTGSTVSFNGTANQVIPGFAYNNLMTSNGWKGIAGTTSVVGNLTLTSGALSDSSFVLTVIGNIANTGVHKSGSGEIYLNGGASAHLISGGGTFANVELNDGSGVTTSGNFNVGGILTLTRGIITTGGDSVVIVPGGTVNRAVSGLPRHVYGNMKMYAAAGSPVSITFQIGDASNYAPVGITFASVSAAGYVVASTVGTQHPSIKISGIDQASDASRYWTIKNLNVTFTTYSLTLNFASGDLVGSANTAYFFIRRFSSPLWYGTNTSVRTSSSTESIGLGPTEFGDFAVGQLQGYFRWTGIGGDSKWSTASNWSFNSIPTSMNDVVLDTTAVINSSTANDSCRSLTINNSGIQLSITSGALSISGSLTMSAGIFNTQTVFPAVPGSVSLTGGKVGFNGTGAQTIPAYSYYDLSVSGAHVANNITLASGTISVADSFITTATFAGGTWVNTGNTFIYNGSAGQFIGAIRYNNLSIVGARGANNITFSNTDTLHIAGTPALSATFNSGSGYVLTGTIFDYNGSGAQTIPCLPYNSLVISGARTTNTVTLSSTDTIHVANVFNPSATFSSGGYQSTGTIFEYNGTGAQTIAAINYNNLIISGARTTNNVTLANSGTIGITGVLTTSATFTSGGYINTGSTINYNGTGAQTVNAFAYNNLTISAARAANYVTLANTGTISIAGTFTASATFSGGDYVSTGSTVVFNGGGAQTIPSFRFNNLQTATGGTKTAGGALTVYGNLNIGASSTLDASSTIDTLYGNWINNGTFTPTTSEIIFAGPPNSSISGATSFNNLTINKSSSTINITVSNNIQAVNLAMISGSMGTGSNTVTITSTRTGNGIILGTITRTHVFNAGTSYAFESPNSTLNFNSGGTLPSSITIFVDTVSPGANTYMQPINRYYTISQTGGSGFTYTMRLHYQNSEVALPNIKSTLKAWQRTSTGPDVWARLGATSIDTVNYWVENTGVTSVGTWSLSSTTVPNIVLTLTASAVNPAPGDTVTYTIAYSNTGDGSATNTIVTASAPLHTSYAANSVTVNSIPKTDAADADGVTVSGGNITVNLATVVGTIAPGANGTITYQVIIN